MRLITHNMLKCNKKDVEQGYPLRIESEKIEIISSEFNQDVTKKLINRIRWKGLKSAVQDLNLNSSIEFDASAEDIVWTEELLRELHHLLFEIHVLEGYLICPESTRKFPIREGIPNMLLHEDEV